MDDLRRVACTTRIMRRADYLEIIDDMATRLANIAVGGSEMTDTEIWVRDNIG